MVFELLVILIVREPELPPVMTMGRGIGDANSVMRLDGEFYGVSDPRNAGAAAGK